HDHPVLDRARARGHERARALQLDHADAADVRRLQRLPEAQRRGVDLELPAGVEDRRALGDLDLRLVDREGDPARRHANTPTLPMADSMAEDAVWPRPQIEASRIASPISAISASSSWTVPRVRPESSRASASSWRTVPTRQGTHWPQLSSRKNAAMTMS